MRLGIAFAEKRSPTDPIGEFIDEKKGATIRHMTTPAILLTSDVRFESQTEEAANPLQRGRARGEQEIHIKSATIYSIEEIKEKAARYFDYEPSFHMTIDALLLTGAFKEEDIIENIRRAFTRKADPRPKRRTFYIVLTPEAFRICRYYGRRLRPRFKSRLDLHTLANAMLQTASYTLDEVVKKIEENACRSQEESAD